MKFNDYQKRTKNTAIYPEKDKFSYLGLGISSEAGEVADIFKKVIRDDNGKINDEKKGRLKKELGDVLWYVSQIGNELGFELSEIAESNLDKLSSRKDRSVLGGSGDNR